MLVAVIFLNLFLPIWAQELNHPRIDELHSLGSTDQAKSEDEGWLIAWFGDLPEQLDNEITTSLSGTQISNLEIVNSTGFCGHSRRTYLWAPFSSSAGLCLPPAYLINEATV